MISLFDRDELGDDPEEDDEFPETCPQCLKLWEECECDDDDDEGEE